MPASSRPNRRRGNVERAPLIVVGMPARCPTPHGLDADDPYPGRPAAPQPARAGGGDPRTSGRPRAPSRPRSSSARAETTSSSSTTGRPSPTGSPTTATSSPASSRTPSPATRPCGAGGSSAASAGTATACRPRWRPRRSSACRAGARSSSTASTASTTTAGRSVQRNTDEWERYVTRQARWVDFANDYKTMDLSYMESVMWAFKQPVGQGPALRGLPGPALLLGVRDPAVELRDPPGRRLPAPARTRRSRSCSRSSRRRRARPPSAVVRVWRGRRRRGRCRRTWPSPSAPDIDYAVYELDGRAPP